MVQYLDEELLILTKTYPVPSANYRETSCVAAVNSKGQLRRLFPIPFRFLDNEKKFKKWQWINAKIYDSSDRRNESYRIDVDTIIPGQFLEPKNAWRKRIQWLDGHIYNDFEDLEDHRVNNISLGVIKPTIQSLIIEKEDTEDWTEKEKSVLFKEGLFDPIEVKKRFPLKKLPYGFFYEYRFPENDQIYKQKITDWEVGRLYWRCVDLYKENWEGKFRYKMEDDMKKKNMHFLMGTMHRFQYQWLIIGLIYPPNLPQQYSLWKEGTNG